MNMITEKWFNKAVHDNWEATRQAPDNLRERLESVLTDQELRFLEYSVGWIAAVGDLMQRDGAFDETGITAGGIREFDNALCRKGGYENE